jgi:plastocyanin
VVVYLKDAPKRPLPPVHLEIRQQDENFIPRVVAVPVGSVVDFPNGDPIYHNVFSLSRAKAFNLGRYPQGQSRPVRFDKPGLVKVFCEIHSHMSATVLVFDHPWYAVPGDDGRFELPAVPTGDRQITAWHERLGDTTLKVRIEAGRPAEADFVLPVPQQP